MRLNTKQIFQKILENNLTKEWGPCPDEEAANFEHLINKCNKMN